MANTHTEQLELIVEALHCLQHGASRLGLEDLFHLLGVAELEAQDILQKAKPKGKCAYAITEGKAAHLNRDQVKCGKLLSIPSGRDGRKRHPVRSTDRVLASFN